MSYCLYSVILDIKEIASAIGSKDESIISAVKALDPEEYEDDDDWDVEEEDEICVGQAIDDLIFGLDRHPESAHQYGYALAEICRSKGHTNLATWWGAVRWHAIEECGLVDLMTKTGPPIPIEGLDDFPRIGTIHRERLDTYIDAASKRKASVDSELGEGIDEYLGWLKHAKAENLDIVFIYH